jgi:hypothetical protein
VDSIPTCGNQEDHVSMSMNASLHARSVVANIEAVVGIELLMAAQALDLRVAGVRVGHILAELDGRPNDHGCPIRITAANGSFEVAEAGDVQEVAIGGRPVAAAVLAMVPEPPLPTPGSWPQRSDRKQIETCVWWPRTHATQVTRPTTSGPSAGVFLSSSGASGPMTGDRSRPCIGTP